MSDHALLLLGVMNVKFASLDVSDRIMSLIQMDKDFNKGKTFGKLSGTINEMLKGTVDTETGNTHLENFKMFNGAFSNNEDFIENLVTYVEEKTKAKVKEDGKSQIKRDRVGDQSSDEEIDHGKLKEISLAKKQNDPSDLKIKAYKKSLEEKKKNDEKLTENEELQEKILVSYDSGDFDKKFTIKLLGISERDKSDQNFVDLLELKTTYFYDPDFASKVDAKFLPE